MKISGRLVKRDLGAIEVFECKGTREQEIQREAIMESEMFETEIV